MTQRSIAARGRDDGFTLIEVLVALLVFAIISTGIVAGLTTVIRTTGDNRARITAANLASQDLDLVRAIGNPFEVSKGTSTTYLNNTTFTVTRSVKWVSNAGADLECAGGTSLLYLRVNVRVTWTGMLPTTSAVQDDTLIAPEGRTSTSGTGSIAVLVTDSGYDGVAGSTVSIAPVVGGTGQTLTAQPSSSNADGCTYATQVAPGAYDVTATKPGYVDPTTGSAKSTTQVVVEAGESAAAPLTLTPTSRYTVKYVPAPQAYDGTPALPTNLITTFVSSAGRTTTSAPASTVTLPAASAYTAVAGELQRGATTCQSTDPMAWRQETLNGVQLQQGARAAAVGNSLAIPVGVVEVLVPAGTTLKVVRPVISLLADDPGCDITDTVLTYSAKGRGLDEWTPLAVPFGSWRVTANGVPLLGPAIRVPTNTATAGVNLGGVVTLDPRTAR